MNHCAIDVGGKKSQICVRDSGGTIQFEGTLETPADALVSCRTKLINNVRGWLRGHAQKPRSVEAATFTQRVRAFGELPVNITSELTVIDALSKEIGASEKRFAALTSDDP